VAQQQKINENGQKILSLNKKLSAELKIHEIKTDLVLIAAKTSPSFKVLE
jgi:hypothetical protein